jgi:thioredoxin-dependent peroxiredoxin
MSKKLRGKSASSRSATKSTATTRPAKAKAKPVAPKRTTKAAAKTARKVTAKAGAEPRKTEAVELHEGQIAPAFELQRDGGGTVALRDFAGRKLVLFFYPRANTPGCTREAMDFSRLKADFAASGTDVIGLSADSVKAQESFQNKYKLATPLASDEQKDTLKAYGVWGEKSLYGRKFLGIVRTTVLIDGKGRIARIWRNVKVDGHADEVLAVSRTL